MGGFRKLNRYRAGQHHMQTKRRMNILAIQLHIKKADKDLDKTELIRWCQLTLGCTEKKANEYVKLVLG